MEVAINWWGVILATLSTMVIGSIWYTPKVFGNKWMKLIGKSEKDLGKNGMWPILVTLIVSFVTAYILAYVSFLSNQYFHNSFMQDAIVTALWLWAGFVAARFITHDSFEGRPWQLTLMNVGHELVTFVVMALLIGWLHP